MNDPDYNYIRVRADTVTDPLIRRLTDPPFGTETSERNLMAEAARALLDAWAERDAALAIIRGKTFTVDEAQEEIARVKADAEAAVALVLEAAAKLCDQYVTPFGRAGSAPDAVEGAVHGLAPVIRALAPASGLAAVQELRAERDAAVKRVQVSIDIHNRKAWEAVARAERAETERDTLAAKLTQMQVAWGEDAVKVEELTAELAASREREKGLREALNRQVDNMAFVINHVTLPDAYYEKFLRELEEDRAALAQAPDGEGG